MLLFRSEAGVDEWCQKHGHARGAVLSLAQVWRLSQLWYYNRLDEDFHGRSIAEAEEIFRHAGLHGPFWEWRDDK